VQRNGDFTVNIALIQDGHPILAVVYAPALNLTYGAAEGLGAFQVVDSQRVAIHTRATPERPTLVISRSHADAALDQLLTQVPPHDAVSRGSSLKFCQVASAEADLYPRTGPTCEWDTAAGQCVAEQAGARVLRLPDLAPFVYNQKESLLNPGFVVIGDQSYGWEERLRQALATA
jgi:3'(2'), 5'-bisphosphate nucleotidase